MSTTVLSLNCDIILQIISFLNEHDIEQLRKVQKYYNNIIFKNNRYIVTRYLNNLGYKMYIYGINNNYISIHKKNEFYLVI